MITGVWNPDASGFQRSGEVVLRVECPSPEFLFVDPPIQADPSKGPLLAYLEGGIGVELPRVIVAVFGRGNKGISRGGLLG